jgi:hypothetical protein
MKEVGKKSGMTLRILSGHVWVIENNMSSSKERAGCRLDSVYTVMNFNM